MWADERKNEPGWEVIRLRGSITSGEITYVHHYKSPPNMQQHCKDFDPGSCRTGDRGINQSIDGRGGQVGKSEDNEEFLLGLTQSHPELQFGKTSWADAKLAKRGRAASRWDFLIFLLIVGVGGRGWMWLKGGVRTDSFPVPVLPLWTPAERPTRMCV